MPPLPSPGDVIRIHLSLKDNNNNVFGSRFYLKYSGGPPTQADLNTLSTNVRTAFSSDLAGLMATYLELSEVICTDLSSNTGAEGTDSTAVAGTRSGTGLLINDAANIGFEIVRRYRGGKPKIFLPFGVTTDTSSDRTFTNTFVTAVNTGWGSFIAAILAGSYSSFNPVDNCNISYYSGFTVAISPTTGRARNVPTKRTTPVVDTITGHACSTTVGSQRRRLRAA
jgi:hypothetical protein